MKSKILSFLLSCLLVLSSGLLKAQDIEIDSLNILILNHINSQRISNNLEEVIIGEVVDNAAQDQANYCATIHQETNVQKESKKIDAANRVAFYGGIKNGAPQEIIISEAIKNSRGTEYGLEELKNKVIKKLDRTTIRRIYLRPDLYYIGARAAIDQINGKVYVCIVMGDINIANNASSHSKDLDKNYKIKKHAFHWWLRKVGCKINCVFGKCDEGTVCNAYDDLKELFNKVEIDKGFYIKDGKLYLKESFKKYFSSDERNTTKLLSDNNDRLIVYIIEKSQFPCNTNYNISLGANIQTGIELPLKPITYKQIISKGDIVVDKLPKGFSGDFELAFEVVKYCDEKLKCEVYNFYDKLIRLKPYLTPVAFETLPLLLDTQSAQVKESYMEFKTLSWNIPFERNKFEYKQSDIEPIIDSLNEPKFIIQEIKITAYSSVEGDSAKNYQLQVKRAESIVKVLEQKQPGVKIKYTIQQGDAWSLFRKQVVLTNYYYLADSSQAAIRQKFYTDTTMLRKLEPILQAERFATVQMRVAFDLKKLSVENYWSYRINKAIEKKAYKIALNHQTTLLQLVQNGEVTKEQFLSISIPENDKTISLMNNRAVLISDSKEQLKEFEKINQLVANNPIVKYNILALRLNEISKLDNNARREELQILASQFTSLTANAIPVKIYNTLRTRFHPILNMMGAGKKSKKAETYKNIKELSQNSPLIEAVFLADFYADQKRFDMAAQILLDHYNELSEEQIQLCKEYCLRMIYYSKSGKLASAEKQYYPVFKKLQKTNPELFCEVFNASKVSFKFFENLHIKKLYCDTCLEKK
ncbi:MAG: hypothetical protein IT246_04405 [Bacteroidia bacterium]|nr:hypothetical protein [Bacteroidia bacterium]